MTEVARRIAPLVGLALGGWPGYLIGTVLGGLLFPPQSKTEPAELAKVKLSGPARGDPLPIAYGRTKVAGKLIWKGPLTTHEPGSSKKGGAKGSATKGSTENVTTYSRSLMFALAESLARSLVQDDVGSQWKLFRIWAGDDLIYDVDDPAVQGESGVDLTFYPGDPGEDPDPRMSAYQLGGAGATTRVRTEGTQLEGSGPTYTVRQPPVVSGTDRIWAGGGGGGGGTFGDAFDPSLPMRVFTRVASSPGQDEYTINYTTGLITFGGTYGDIGREGVPLQISVQYETETVTAAQEALAYPYVCKIYLHEYNTGPSQTPPNLTFEIGPGDPQVTPLEDNVWITEASWSAMGFGSHELTIGGQTQLGKYGEDGSGNPLFYMGMRRGTNLELVKISKTIAPTIVATIPAPSGTTWLGPIGCVAVPDGVIFGATYSPTWPIYKFRLYYWDGLSLSLYIDNEPDGFVGVGGWNELQSIAYATRTGYLYFYCRGVSAPGGLMQSTSHVWWGYPYLGGKDNTIIKNFLVNGNIMIYPHGWTELGEILWWSIDYVGSNNMVRISRRDLWQQVLTPGAQGGSVMGEPWVASDGFTYAMGNQITPGQPRLMRYNPGTNTFDILSGTAAGLPTGAIAPSVAVKGGEVAWVGGSTGLEIWKGDNVDRIDATNSPDLNHTHTPTKEDVGIIYVFSGDLNTGTIKRNGATEQPGGAEDVLFCAMLRDIIVSPYGAALPASIIDAAKYTVLRSHCDTNDLRGAGSFESPALALRIAEEILSHYFGWLGYIQGALVFGAKRTEVALREVVRDDAMRDGQGELNTGLLRETKNRVRVDWTDRAERYNSKPFELADDDDRARTGDRLESLSLRLITRPALVSKITAKALYLLSRPAFSYAMTMGPKELVLAPGDVVGLTDKGEGLSQMPARIMAISESEDRGQFRIEFIDEPSAILALAVFPVSPVQGINPGDPAPSPIADPGPTTPAIFELPAALSNGQLRLGFALAGSTMDWIGTAIYLSLDGVSYTRARTYIGPSAILGWTTGAAIPELPDQHYHDLMRFQADVGLSLGQPMSVERNAMLAGLNSIYVGSELMTFRDAILIAGSEYRFCGLLRGWYGLGPAMHDRFTPVAVIRADVPTQDFLDAQVGSTVYFKFASINQAGVEQSLGGLPAYAVTLGDRGRQPPPVFGLQLLRSGQRKGSLSVIGTGALDVAIGWLYAHPQNTENRDVVDGLEVIEHEPAFQDFIVRVWSKGTVGGAYALRRTVTSLTAESYTYTAAGNIADAGSYQRFLKFEVEVRRTTGVRSPAKTIEIEVVQ